MTPDVQAAAERIRAYLGARASCTAERCHEDALDQHFGANGTVPAPALLVTDLRTLLAALDPADAPIGHIPTEQGRELVNAYRAHRTRQNPRGGERT